MTGMSRISGRSMTNNAPSFAHVHQSLNDIYSTLIGTRICRRDYGSVIPHLIDQPCNEATRLKLMSAAVTAAIRWEPRIKITQAVVNQHADQPSRWTLTTQGSFVDKNGQTSTFTDQFLLGAAV